MRSSFLVHLIATRVEQKISLPKGLSFVKGIDDKIAPHPIRELASVRSQRVNVRVDLRAQIEPPIRLGYFIMTRVRARHISISAIQSLESFTFVYRFSSALF